MDKTTHGGNRHGKGWQISVELDDWFKSAPEMKAGSKAQQEEAAKALAKYAEIYPVLKTPPKKK